MSGRTWTDGAVWLAEFESGADAVDAIEGGWLDAQPELAEEACAAVRAGVEPMAQELRTGVTGRGVTTIALIGGRDLEVQAFGDPIELVADTHFGGVDAGAFNTGDSGELQDQWDGVDVVPDDDGIDGP